MNIEQIRDYCLKKKGVSEGFPFNESTLVFKVLHKMFLLAPLDKWEAGKATITVKCNPEYTTELRAQYQSVYPGPYVSNKHWNTLALYQNQLSLELVLQLIDHSYEMVVKGLTKKDKERLDNL